MAEPTRQLKIELGNKLEQLRIDKGIKLTDSKGLSALRDSLDEAGIKLPEGYNISSLREFFKRKQKNPNAVLALTKSKSGTGPTVRSGREEYPGQRSIATTKPEVVARRSAQTNAFINRILDLGYDEAQIEKYFFETDRDLRALINAVKRQNKKLPEGLKISFGHLNRLSESINSPRNVFLELLSENIEKGNRYSENPAAMIAIGNPSKEGVGWLENWTRDFTLWADKPENGGSGVMPQRGDFGSVIERQIHRLTGNQFDSLDEAGKIDAINQVDDLLTDIEKRNQWLPSENKQLRRWGLLSPEDYDQALAQLNDNEAKYFVKPKVDVTDVGRPLGGIRSFLTNAPKVGKGILYTTGAAALNLGFQGVADAATDPGVWRQIGRIQKGKEEGDEEVVSQATSDLGTEAAWAVGTGLGASALIGKFGLAKYFMNPVTAIPMVGAAGYYGVDAYMEGRGMKGPTQRYANLLKYDQKVINERTGEREFIARPEKEEARQELAGAIERIGEERANNPNNVDSLLKRFGL